MSITQELLHEVFEYKDGVLYWKVNRGPVKSGDTVGNKAARGYLQTSVNGKPYYVHRLIFMMHKGHLPSFVDHINNNRMDNRIENLRACTKSENAKNSKKFSNNTSGHKGVSWHKATGKWEVRLTINGVFKHLGLFDDLELAALVADEARSKYHKEFARCH